MRLKHVLINSLLGLGLFFITGVLGFVRRGIMFDELGSNIVGLIALFSDVLALLNMADIGLSGAIGAALYGPIHNKEFSRIKGILQFYKKLYRYAGLIFIFLALIALGPIEYLVSDGSVTESELRIYFILYAINTALTYFFSYRLILTVTDQKLYTAKIYNAVLKVLTIIIEILVLVYFGSFVLLLIATFILNIIYLLIMNIVINRGYSELKQENELLLDSDKKEIIRSIKGLVFHRVAAFAVSGTNYIYTTLFAGLHVTAIYSNYQLIITMINRIINSLFLSITSSIGNIIAAEDSGTRFQHFKVIFMVNFWLVSVSSIIFINASHAFVSFWVGNEYLVNSFTVYLLVGNFFLTAIRPATEQFKYAAGIFYEDRYVPIVEALVNAAACLILGYMYGLQGVLMGNLISTLGVVFWQKPYITFKHVFRQSVLNYFKLFSLHFSIFVFAVLICKWIISYIVIPQSFFGFILASVISFVVYNLIFIICLKNTKEYKKLYGYVKVTFNKIKRNKK